MSAELPPRLGSADKVCPVCRRPDQGGAVCERCGWELIDSLEPGAGTAADRLDREVRLADRQRDYDLRAAARAAADVGPADQLLLASLADVVRGGPLTPGQIEQAMARVKAEDPPPVSSAGMVFVLTRLVAMKTDAVAFVEIGPDVVSLQVLVVDELGVPVRLEGESLPWTAILQLLPVHLGLRYLRMAGGVGVVSSEREDADPAALVAAVGESITPLLARFVAAAAKAAAIGQADRAPDDPDVPDTLSNSADGTSRLLDTVLVRRARGWLLLDAAAERARAVMRPVAEIAAGPASGTLADVVDAVAARAPLRYGYDLILVETNRRTGMVRPRSHELFPAGTAVMPGTLPVATIAVSPVTGYAAEQLALPIVARRAPVADLRDVEALEEQRPLIAMAVLDAATGGPFQVRVELARPGLVQLQAPQEFLLADAVPGGWPELMVDLPERLWSAARLSAGSLDLALLVELGGAGDQAVAARVRLIRDIIREFRDVPEARIAVLGYRDHFDIHHRDKIGVSGQEEQALIVGSIGGFSTSDDLQSMLQQSDWWSAVPVRNDYAAPVEEALWLLTGDQWDWRPDARHVVLIVGRRPPHPAITQPPGAILPCRNGLSWREALERLQREQALQCFAVLDDDPAPGYAANAWQALTARGRVRIARRTTAQMLAQDCGLAPRSHAQLRLATFDGAASFPAAGQEEAP
jgi:hypothetical protein